MLSKKILLSMLCITALVIFAASAWAETAAPAKAASKSLPNEGTGFIDKRALNELKLMSDTIAQAKTVRFQAHSMVPVKTPGGVWVSLYGTSQVVMQGPDKLFAHTGGDFWAHDLYFDGKTITRFSPDKNLYSVKDEPGTIDDLIDKAYEEEWKSFPFADILISKPYEIMTKDLKGALYVGQSTTMPFSGRPGVKTDHLTFSNEGVEWQIWIGVDDHLPRLVVATYLDDVREPSYSVEFGDWKLNDPVSPETFIFKNTTNAVKVEFRNPKTLNRSGLTGAAAKK